MIARVRFRETTIPADLKEAMGDCDPPEIKVSAQAAKKGQRLAESDDDCSHIVAVLNSGWRVIECRDRVQWILQQRNNSNLAAKYAWRGRCYCRTKEALLRVCNQHAGQIDHAARLILEGLPQWIEQTVRADPI